MIRRFWLPLGLLAACIGFFSFSKLDLEISRAIYQLGNQSWAAGDSGLWKFFYDFGVFPAVLLLVIAVLTLILGLDVAYLRRFRQAALYFMGCVLMGPGLLINAICKGLWGRPRPKQLAEFGGCSAFEPILQYDASSCGKSLACGHASMGFILFALVFLLPQRSWRWLAGLSALTLGTLIGVARVMQGGHFTSDVLLAGGICWFTAFGLARWMKLQPGRLLAASAPEQLPVWTKHSIRFGVLALLSLVLLATPRQKSTSYNPEPCDTALSLDIYGTLELTHGPKPALRTRVEGFGAPKSKLRFTGPASAPAHQVQGFFTEMRASTILSLPPGEALTLTLASKLEALKIPDDFHPSAPLNIVVPANAQVVAPDPLPDGVTLRRL